MNAASKTDKACDISHDAERDLAHWLCECLAAWDQKYGMRDTDHADMFWLSNRYGD